MEMPYKKSTPELCSSGVATGRNRGKQQEV